MSEVIKALRSHAHPIHKYILACLGMPVLYGALQFWLMVFLGITK